MKKITLAGISAVIIVAGILTMFTTNLTPTDSPKGHAALLPANVDELRELSDVIVIAKVQKVGQSFNQEDPKITRTFSDVSLKIEKILKGTLDDDQLSVRTRPDIQDEAKFKNGERVLLYLVKGKITDVEGENYVILGMYQGKFELSNGKAMNEKYPEGLDEQQLIQNITSKK